MLNGMTFEKRPDIAETFMCMIKGKFERKKKKVLASWLN